MEKAADFFRLDLVRRRCWRRACPNGNHLGTYGFTLTPKFADALWGVISGVIIIYFSDYFSGWPEGDRRITDTPVFLNIASQNAKPLHA